MLASTHSAQSEWVGRELDWWLSHREPATILILVTDGEVAWRAADRDFEVREHATAIQPRLRGQFPEEPLWVDLRSLGPRGVFRSGTRTFAVQCPDCSTAVRQIQRGSR